MVKVRFTVDGSVVTAEAEPGDTIMQVAVRHGMPGIEGECGGELSCATCHVFVEAQGFRPLSEEEGELLELVEERTDASRLSCQLVVREEQTDIEVTIP